MWFQCLFFYITACLSSHVSIYPCKTTIPKKTHVPEEFMRIFENSPSRSGCQENFDPDELICANFCEFIIEVWRFVSISLSMGRVNWPIKCHAKFPIRIRTSPQLHFISDVAFKGSHSFNRK